MAARLGLRPIASPHRYLSRVAGRSRPATDVCLLCSLSTRRIQIPSRARQKSPERRRAESTVAASTANPTSAPAREELTAALTELQKRAANYVNLSRVRLALRNLSQPPGRESIRIAVLSMTNGSESGNTAKKLINSVLADPLKPEEDWERQLTAHDSSQPLVVRVGQEAGQQNTAFEFVRGSLAPELHVSSPSFNGNDLDILVMDTSLFDAAQSSEDIQGLEDAILVPAIDIPSSATGGHTTVTAPVHKSLLVGDGIIGAASVLSLPLLQDTDTVVAAINLKQHAPEDFVGSPFKRIDVDSASKGISLFRNDIGSAIEYEKLWFESNVPAIADWLKAGIVSNDESATKTAVRDLIASILQNATSAIQDKEAAGLSAALSSKVSPSSLATLNEELSTWAQEAHQELQEQLDVAFTGRKWRKLGWWKLFWRVDDVGMLSSEILAQRFLSGAERGIIYLAGRLREARITDDAPERLTYPGPALAPLPLENGGSAPSAPTPELEGKWPTHIPFTRNYLLGETVPALQALAQKLVTQSLATSALTTSLGVLTYLSAFSAYEAGTIAALGIVWSMRRLQKKWETARSYWEGEVREEARKAVRASEASVAQALDASTSGHRGEGDEAIGELGEVRQLVRRAEDALARLR